MRSRTRSIKTVLYIKVDCFFSYCYMYIVCIYYRLDRKTDYVLDIGKKVLVRKLKFNYMSLRTDGVVRDPGIALNYDFTDYQVGWLLLGPVLQGKISSYHCFSNIDAVQTQRNFCGACYCVPNRLQRNEFASPRGVEALGEDVIDRCAQVCGKSFRSDQKVKVELSCNGN